VKGKTSMFRKRGTSPYLKCFSRCDSKMTLFSLKFKHDLIDLRALDLSHDYIRPSHFTSYNYFFTWFSLSDATTNWSQVCTWTSVVSVAGTRLLVSQSEEELNDQQLSLNDLLVRMKCVNVLTVVNSCFYFINLMFTLFLPLI